MQKQWSTFYHKLFWNSRGIAQFSWVSSGGWLVTSEWGAAAEYQAGNPQGYRCEYNVNTCYKARGLKC